MMVQLRYFDSIIPVFPIRLFPDRPQPLRGLYGQRYVDVGNYPSPSLQMTRVSLLSADEGSSSPENPNCCFPLG